MKLNIEIKLSEFQQNQAKDLIKCINTNTNYDCNSIKCPNCLFSDGNLCLTTVEIIKLHKNELLKKLYGFLRPY